MQVRRIFDFHLHLNGSFSLVFLEKVAQRNGQDAIAALEGFKKTQAVYKTLTNKKEQVANLWGQFGFIHKIVKTLEDIQEGTVDVISESKAHYLEIRSTPKAIGEAKWEDYVKHFVSGIQEGNKQAGGKKCARGILSLDRCVHNLETAKPIIDAVTNSALSQGMLVGIDIGGNFLGKRTLTGEVLAETLRYALSKNVNLAIHVGEGDTDIEKQDTDIVLKTVEEWKKEHPKQMPMVRLGHAIYLTDAQAAKVRELKLPVEVCPSCHDKLGWWNKDQAHPVTRIYNSLNSPILPGTDDQLLFLENALTEMMILLSMFGEAKLEEGQSWEQHLVQYCFDQAAALALLQNSPRRIYPPALHEEMNTGKNSMPKEEIAHAEKQGLRLEI